MKFMSSASFNDYLWLRMLPEPSYQTEETGDPYAMIFVLNGFKTPDGDYAAESDVFQAAVNGMLSVLQDTSPEVREPNLRWMDGRIRKLMKRVKPSSWDALIDELYPHHVGVSGSAEVAVFAPMRVTDQPDKVRKAQMSGLVIQNQEPAVTSTPYLQIVVDSTLGMSTGKLVAQTCHAAQLFLMRGPEEQVTQWLDTGASVRVERVDRFPDLTTQTVVIQDAGFTEIPAGSVTAAAVFIPDTR